MAKENPKKKDGTLKKKYKDLPRFKAINGYEGKFKEGYRKILKSMILDVSKNLTTHVPKKTSK